MLDERATEVLPKDKIGRPFFNTIQSNNLADKRFSPRIETNFPVKLFPGDMEGNVCNISETGIYLDCVKQSLPKDILLSMKLPLSEPTEIPARVMWHSELAEDRFRVGAQFSLSSKDCLLQVRDFVFDGFAEKASAIIENGNEDLKIRVGEFFNTDIKQYHEDMSILAKEIDERKIESRDAEKKLTTLINGLLLKGNDLEKLIDNKIYIKKIKEIFRETVGCWFYKSPIVKMAYDKPRGYPGDYKLFETIYNKKPLAKDKSLGFYWDNYFLNNAYTMAVRTRKNKMKNILEDFIENTELETIRLLNIACGPSREIRELLSDSYLASRKHLIFTGLDNDKDALEFSKSALNNLPSCIETRFLNENVLDIFRDKKYYDIIGKQDIIYILGLTEYLPDRIFKRLIHFLFELLNEKGILVVTYKNKEISFHPLPPDWLCDWAFIKRSKDNLINTAKELGSGKYSLKIEEEGSGSIFFLILTKT